MKAIVSLVAAALVGWHAVAQSAPAPEIRQLAENAIKKGLAYLDSVQRPNGSWSDETFPALTALPLWAYAGAGPLASTQAIAKATAFVVSKAQPDGGIYVPKTPGASGGLGNYNTCVCMTALHALGDRSLAPVILKARNFIASSQLDMEGIHQGGFGYDKATGKPYSDMLNLAFAADAMRRTQNLEELRPSEEKRADLNWDAALEYAKRMQQDNGGFVYNPRHAKAGTSTNSMGRVRMNTYGSITYSGLLTMLHCRLDRSDPRVKSAYDYLGKFWTLDENPGMGPNGLYFYYTIMARALVAADQDAALTHEGKPLPWRDLLVRKLCSLQKENGSWSNESNRWWENDPVLATAYSLVALEFATGLTR
ncbi:MAG: prenyltransferase/squalene oxidase repeat-containing protein [Kiritimatiellia bacterium]